MAFSSKWGLYGTGNVSNSDIIQTAVKVFRIPGAFRHCKRYYEYHCPLQTLSGERTYTMPRSF